jgi:probable rRNA maturation factor
MDPEGPVGQHRSHRALRVLVGDERGRRVPSAPALARWLKEIAPARARGTVSVAVVSDARVRALNRRYRGVDSATDVLSFPTTDVGRTFQVRRSPAGLNGPRYVAASPEPRAIDHRPPAADHCLGDIVIARGVARRQARDAGHSELTEWRVLALHGLLHLLGYDHDRDSGRMRRVERRLRRRGGLPNGLIERAGRS